MALEALNNLNRLAGTNQTTCLVDKTLEYFCCGIGSDGLVDLRHQAVNRLIRMKVLDQARPQGEVVILVDGSGYLAFRDRHCEHCLTQQHGENDGAHAQGAGSQTAGSRRHGLLDWHGVHRQPGCPGQPSGGEPPNASSRIAS